jgi:hypothetical protein
MFPLLQSDHADVSSQESLKEDSGHHWTPGIEVAAIVSASALDNKIGLCSRCTSPQTGTGKLVGTGYTGKPIFASSRSSHCRAVIREWGCTVSAAWPSHVHETSLNTCVDKFKSILARTDERVYGFLGLWQPFPGLH